MTPESAMERINLLTSHAWMVRQFLKHADEVQEDEEMLEVHRMIYDYLRALEPSYLRKDSAEYVRRARGKLSKLRKVAEFFSANWQRASTHTNFEMAATSLKFVVQQIEEVLAEVETHNPALPGPLPEGVGQHGIPPESEPDAGV